MSLGVTDRALIIGSGESMDLNSIRDYQYIICADGGYHHIEGKIKPDIIIGDFDSVSPCNLPPGIETMRFPEDKDNTDTELCIIHALNKGIEHIDITGIYGSRPDHFFTGISLLRRYIGMDITLQTERFSIFIIKPAERFVFKELKGRTVSFFSLSSRTQIIDAEGFRYPLKRKKLKLKIPVGVSNQIVRDNAEIYYKKGALLCFIEK